MGLISYFRNLYYENRLKKADYLLNDGRASEAESYYLYLLDKHPQAAGRLAEYYLSLSSEKNIKNDVALFRKSVNLISNSGGVCDIASYENILKKHIEYISEMAKKLFSTGRYEDCVSLTSVLKETQRATIDITTLHSEAKLRLLYEEIDSVKVISNSFGTLVEVFKTEWYVCKGTPRAKDSALELCRKLEESKRYYASILFLSFIYDNPFAEQCLNNAVCIVYGHDSEITPNIIKSVVSSYGQKIILKKGITNDAAVSLFDACWNQSGDVIVIMDVLNSVKEPTLKDAFVNNILKNHSKYLTSANLFVEFTKWLYNAFDNGKTLQLFEHIHTLGFDVKNYYTQKVHEIISNMPYENRLSYLNYAQILFPDSSIIVEDKLICAQKYIENKKDEEAIKVLDSIFEKSEKAHGAKALALCNLAKKESNVDTKIELLNQSQAILNSYKGPERKKIEAFVIEGLIKSASLLYENNNKEKAYSILHGLAKNGSEEAIFTIADYRLKENLSIQSNEEKYKHSTDAINEIKKIGIDSVSENSIFISLWDERINSLIVNSKLLDNKSAVDVFEAILKEISSAGFNPDVQKTKYASIVKHLIERKYLIAREQELAGDLTAASLLYREINVLEAKRTPTLAALRFTLCKLKMQNVSDALGHRDNIYTILRKAAAAYKTEKEDIAYRFALILLKSGEDQEALSVLNEFLPDEEYLKKACAQGAIIKALAKLEDFNNKLDSVKNKSLSSNDAVYFINHMLEYAEVIKPVLDLPRATLTKYRNKLKNYAIFKLFDEERYDVAFEKMVKEHKDYLDDYTALRNIALVCLNMAEAKQITTANYQEVISIWLTAIYQEKLFVKSLDYTSWDDPFTFSLYEAYGHFNEESIGALPDNVNFDNSTDDSVVLIKEVQRTLLDRFEAAISDNQQYHEFLTSQKDAMDSFIVLNLDKKCRIVAPYLAHKDEDLFQDISDALEQDRKQEYDNWENLLSVGALYQMPQAIYTDYSKAKSYYNDCIATIDSVKTNDANLSFQSSKIELIKRFGKLYSALKSYSNSKVSALSAKDKSDFKSNYNFYLVVCNALRDNTLSFVFSNYVMQYVVGEVNSNSMKKSEAAGYILSIFALDKNNSRVKDNLTTLFEMLARDSSTDSTRAVSNILDSVKNVDTSLYGQLKNEAEQATVDKELGDIVNKLTSKSISESTALQKVYSLYTNNSNNDNVCEILSQLCVACIMKYIINQEYGGSSVNNILDKLKNNKSNTFKRHLSHFRKAYDSYWNELPADAKLTLQGFNPNATLNSHGIALKKGLDYFKSIGGSSSSRSSLFGSSIDDLFI